MVNKRFLLLVIIIFLPAVASADIFVSEVAWMGTEVSANDEWIELYNSGSEPVSLTGWHLNADDGTPSITLSGTIGAGEYALLERTDDTSEPTNEALVIFTGALSNEGESLTLSDSSNVSKQELSFSSGWPAGDSTTKETMQRNGSSWATAEATPGSGYVGGNEEEEEEEEENNEEEENQEQEEEEETETQTLISSDDRVKNKYTKKVLEIEVLDSNIPVGTPARFSLATRDLNGSEVKRGAFFWNMGDGTERVYKTNAPFEHFYEYEGTYIVTFKYYKTFFEDAPPDATDKMTITVSNSGVIISKIHPDGGIELKNTAKQEIDLSDWKLKDIFGKTFTLPEGTLIMASKTITLSPTRTKISGNGVSLMNPSGGVVYTFGEQKETTSSSSSRSSFTSSSSSSTKKAEASDDLDESINLNDKMSANVLDSGLNKKQTTNVWPFVFGLLLLGSAVSVFFVFRKKEETITEDGFELLD